jgi:hypothetical protein
MIRYTCDNCGRLKGMDETWILGFAAENVGVTLARREVTITPVWDDRRACEWLAVHFCSQRCKDKYLTALFGKEVLQPELVARKGRVLRMRRREPVPAAASLPKRRRG